MNKTKFFNLIVIFILLISTSLLAADNQKIMHSLVAKGKKYATFQEYQKAENLYLQAVELKSAEAAYLLATHFINGYGREVDIEQAIDWYTKSVELGYIRANYELGVVYYKYKHNISKAQRYFEQAVALGDIDAYHDLAILHINKKEYKKALKLLIHSNVKFHGPSQYTLAQFYLFNIEVNKNVNTAVDLLTQASDNNYIPAMAQLGKIYASGELVNKNLERAEELFEKCYRLEKKNGLDLAKVLFEQNKIPQAKELLKKLSLAGNKKANDILKKLN